MAVQVKDTAAAIDLMIPITMGQDKLREEIMSGILIQIKIRSSAQVVDINADELGFFPPSCKEIRPYITILMQLGLQTEPHKNDSAVAMSPGSSGRRSTSQLLLGGIKKEAMNQPERHTRPMGIGLHPRYAINVWGCSPMVYGVVHDSNVYAELLISRKVMGQHLRRDERNLAAVQRMKPVWERNNDCYDWIDDPVLQGREVIDSLQDLEDRVVIGGAIRIDGSAPMDVGDDLDSSQ